MDAIRKKMQSLKGETDGLYATIQKFEDATKESNRQADQVYLKLGFESQNNIRKSPQKPMGIPCSLVCALIPAPHRHQQKHISAKSTSNISPTPQKSCPKFWNPMTTFEILHLKHYC